MWRRIASFPIFWAQDSLNNNKRNRCGMSGAGHVERAGSIPGRRGPGISHVEPFPGQAAEIGCALLADRLAVLADDEDMERALVGVIHKGDSLTLVDRDARNREGSA